MFNRGSKRSAKRSVTTKTPPRAATRRREVIEALEKRQLLTTLYGGGAGQLATYFYASDGATTPDTEIAIYGNVTAEFIFMHGATGEIVNRTLNGSVLGQNTFSDSTTPGGSDLFSIYVSQSDINSYIAITPISTQGITPFSGTAGFTVIRPANPKGTTVSVSAGSGTALLGAETAAGSPIIKADINGAAMGVRPAGLDDLPEDPLNDLSAGLHVANGHDLGKFLFGGAVTGKVRVDGSMNLFYAGWLITGDARGATEGSNVAGLPVSRSNDFVTAQDTALGLTQHLVPRQNFFVGGDLQNLVSDGPIGWDGTFGDADPDLAPFYLTGTDIYVRGRIGQVLGNQGNAATVTALNMDPAVAGFTRTPVYQEELEAYNHLPGSGVVGDITLGFPNTPQPDFIGGILLQPTTGRSIVPTSNDAFDTFQMLGTFSSPNGNDVIDLLGVLDPNSGPDSDPVDYYGLGLMAGQTIHVQVRGSGNNTHIGIIDPDGRLVASDYSNLTTPVGGSGATSTYTFNAPFAFTADRPGIYRIVIAEGGDTTFVGTPNTTNYEQYELVVTQAGSMGIGGVNISNTFVAGPLGHAGTARMLDVVPAQHQIDVEGNGDFGGLYISGAFNTTAFRAVIPQAKVPPGSFGFTTVYGSIFVAGGNLRVVDADKIGVGTTGSETSPTGMDLNVPHGGVGLVQTRDATGIMQLNPSIRENFAGTTPVVNPPSTPTSATPIPASFFAIGGDYQVINAASRFTGGVITNKGMGILRAAAISGLAQTYIQLDADNTGFDGKSDLIDISGSIDGPALLHGPGGNFRYMRVGGTITVDPQFGASVFTRVVHDYGESVSFTDDSGSTINVTPVGQRIANPLFDPLNPSAGPQFLLPQLSTQTYPVRSGGVIVMDVQSTGSLAVNTVGGAFNATAEISRIEIHGAGTAPVRATRFANGRFTTTLTPAFTSQALGNDLSVTVTGSAVTDIAYIGVLTAEPTNNFLTGSLTLRGTTSTFSNATLISNSTGGEILGIHAANIGTIRSNGSIGVAKSSIAGNSLNFITRLTIGSGYAARAADFTGDMPVDAGAVIGDTFPFHGQTYGIAVPGDIAEIISNQAIGNVVVNGILGTVVANADGKNVGNVHEGIDGVIWANSTTVALPITSTGLPNGSIISVNIGEGVPSAGSGDFARAGIFANNDIDSIVGKNADIRGDIYWGVHLGSLTLTNGSLIDANLLQTADPRMASIVETANTFSFGVLTNGGILTNLDSITINGNGGIIGTLIESLTINSISVPNGFGILSSRVETSFAGFIRSITVGGYGLRDSVINGGTSVTTVNVTGNGKNLSTNNVSPSVRESESVRADPVFGFGFDPSSGRALTPINDIHAALGTSQASPVVNGVTDTGAIENSVITAQRTVGTIKAQTIRGPYTAFSVGNSIGTIQTRGVINGLQVITGRVGSFLPASNVGNLQMTISGPIDNLVIKGNLDKGSVIQAIGPNGRIGNVSIKKNLNGTIHAVQAIGTVTIGGNLNGSLKVDGTARNSMALKKLQVGGTIANGGLDIGASGAIVNVGQIIVGKSLGASSADTLHVSGSIDKLQVGGTLGASVNVGRTIGTIQAQQISGPVHAGGDIKNLIVKKGGLRGDVTVGNKLQNATVAGGISGNVSANNGIGTVTVSGNVAPGKTIQTGFGQINTLRVSGDLDASVISAGKIGQIIVGRNVGDGTTPMTISAPRLGLLQVGGSIESGVTVDINGPIDALIVGHNIESGAVVKASEITKHQIKGEVFGSLEIG